MKTKNNVFEMNMVGNKGMMSDSNNNAVINLGGECLLIDVGFTIKQALENALMDVMKINYLFITHPDPDHAQLVLLGQLAHWQFPGGVHTPHKIKLLVLPEQLEWVNDYTKHTLGTQGMTLADFFEVIVVENNRCEINGYQVDFIDTTSLHCEGMQSFGLVITHNETQKNMVYTSDIKKLERSEFKAFLNSKTLAIYQDTHATGDPVHAGFEEVLTYYPEQYHHLLRLMHLTGDFSVHENVMKTKGISLTQAGEWIVFN